MQALTVFLSQHLTLAYLFLGLMVALILVEFIRLRRLNYAITAKEAVHLMNREHATVVDLRDKAAFTEGHIIDAVHADTHDVKALAKKLDKQRTKPVILICQTGVSAQKIAVQLSHEGFHVHAITGGIAAWKQADLPLVK